MRILHIITKSEAGGAQSVLINIVNLLCAEHEVTVIAGEGDGKMFDAIDSRVNKIHYPHLCRAISVIKDLQTLYFLWKVNRKLKPDVVHLHSSKAGLLGRIVFPSRKSVYTVHGFDSIRVAHRKLLPIERIMQWRCAAIVGVSQYDTENLRKEGINRHIHLVYNGITEPKPQTTMPPFAIPSSYKKVVMCIARVAKPKRHDIFISCAQQLPDYAFVWIGNMSPMENVPENVFFLGNLANASKYCQYADLFVLPSDYEGLPIAILEAMSYALPVVASNVGGVAEIVIDGKNGYVLPNDVALFVNRIREILQNDDLRQSFSKYSHELYLQSFTAEKMASKYLSIYREGKAQR